jgi:hypothetical protein
MTQTKPPPPRAEQPSPQEVALRHSARPSLVFDAARASAPIDTHAVDLRALDTPTTDLSMRNAVRAAWRAQPLLTVRVDGAPSDQVLALLHALVRRELRFSADHVERFDAGHRIVAITDASEPSAPLLALFPVRVRASASTPRQLHDAREALCR